MGDFWNKNSFLTSIHFPKKQQHQNWKVVTSPDVITLRLHRELQFVTEKASLLKITY